MSTILLVILILLLIGALPTWPYSRGWGYYPSGGLGLIVLVVLILALAGAMWLSNDTARRASLNPRLNESRNPMDGEKLRWKTRFSSMRECIGLLIGPALL